MRRFLYTGLARTMTTKIDFFIRCRKGGGFIARAYVPALEAEGDTLAELRIAVKRLVRSKLGDAPVCLRVGELPGQPGLRRIGGEGLEGVVRPIDLKKGDRILFGKYSGNEVKIDGVEHLLLREDEVLGVIEK